MDINATLPEEMSLLSLKSGSMDINATLPEEMVIQIVARLPVKSVGRCRCVSTRWRSLFSNPGFAKLHVQVSPKLKSLIFQDSPRKPSTTASFEKESLVLRDRKAPFDHKNLLFLGSCNGLVAVLDFSPEEVLFIWNPSTGFFKKLPSRRFPTLHYEFDDYDYIIVGFGYASGSDEYKLVMDAEIYSSKTESWKPIEIPGGYFFRVDGLAKGVLCRGALHWLVKSGDHLSAFDLEKEEFSMMKLPSSSTQWNIIYDFGVTCEGCLFVLAERPVQDCGCVVEFWVMREYGNIDSWTRSLSLRELSSVKNPTRPEWMGWFKVRAISVMETSAFVWAILPIYVGETFLDTLSTFYFCNKEENTGIYTIDRDVSKGVVYEESLCCLA